MRLCALFILMVISADISKAQVSVVEAFPNLSFTRPVDIQHAPDDSDRIFIVSQDGDINVFSTVDTTISESNLFFSLKDSLRGGNEEGLLGLTFHPDYKSNGYFYVSYNPAGSPRKSIIARYKVSSDPDLADQSKKTIILELQQPAGNHNGGQIAFGPDGYLYFGLGDGGGSNDEFGNGQNLKTMLGSMIRIDVNNTSSYGNYAIPADNPFVGNDSSYREEIYAYGLRNPWRWSFDPINGRLWLGDVGQGSWEEIDIIEKGNNYGWNIMEGAHCFSPSSACNDSGLTYPVAEYGRSLGYSVSGGHVYRGSRVPDLYGKYIYGDYGSGRIWTIEYDGVNEPVNDFLIDTDYSISAFGIDKDYELYICDLNGKIFKFYQPGVGYTLPAPSLVSPPNYSDSVPADTINFVWNSVSNADSYILEISSENTFIEDNYYLTTVDTSVRVALLAAEGMDFFWHVRAASGQDTSNWSMTRLFTTQSSETLETPLLLSPVNNADNVPADTVHFTWFSVQNAETYNLEVSSDNSFTADYFFVSTNDTFATVALNTGGGLDFFWHVRAIDGEDSTAWSTSWSFKTKQPTDISESQISPQAFYLQQNYPNPFNPSTVINYIIGSVETRHAVSLHVNLSIYNLSGQRIVTLVDGYQNAGNYSVLFDASQLPSGIYIYRIVTSSGFNQSRKMILLK